MKRVRNPRRGVVDLLVDVWADCEAARARTLIVLITVALSVACLLASRAVAVTTGNQINESLASTALDTVRVSTVNPATLEVMPDPEDLPAPLSHSDLPTTEGVSTVIDAGLYLPLSTEAHAIRRTPSSDTPEDALLTASDATSLSLDDASTVPSSATSAWAGLNSARVALVGKDLVPVLGLPDRPTQADLAIHVGNEYFTVLGIVSSERNPGLNRSVVIPYGTGAAMDPQASPEIVVRTELGASSGVAGLLPDLLRPESPEMVNVTGAESLGGLRAEVATTLDRLLAVVGIALWILTLLIVASVSLSSVMSRVGEIGLRRALGYSRANVAAKFMVEGGILGVLGGMLGVGLGAVGCVAFFALVDWVPYVPVWLVAAGPAAGALTGVLATAYPALRAAAVQPAIAIRKE